VQKEFSAFRWIFFFFGGVGWEVQGGMLKGGLGGMENFEKLFGGFCRKLERIMHM